MRLINHDTVGQSLNWSTVIQALHDGHLLPKAEISDQFITKGDDSLVTRAAWIEGLGFGVKTFSVMPNNAAHGLPSVAGAMLVFEEQHGQIQAVVNSDLVTEWKTAADSALGAKLLARPDAETYLIIGAGKVAESLVRAMSSVLPNLKAIEIWNRTTSKAEDLATKMAAQGYPVKTATDLPSACAKADVISTATLARSPILHGDWITAGTHVDLIGAFRADMREADDTLLQKAKLFVDSRDTTIHHIGELMIPLKSGAIREQDILGDFYDLIPSKTGRQTPEDITVFKNGGGAHLDLMTAKVLMAAG